jgi:hypothetical protein
MNDLLKIPLFNLTTEYHDLTIMKNNLVLFTKAAEKYLSKNEQEGGAKKKKVEKQVKKKKIKSFIS